MPAFHLFRAADDHAGFAVRIRQKRHNFVVFPIIHASDYDAFHAVLHIALSPEPEAYYPINALCRLFGNCLSFTSSSIAVVA